MRRLPPLGPIQAFVHVARLGSMKAAADSLALSSPALSRRIQALEQFVGISLFERQASGLAMTSSGQDFLAEIEPLLDALSLAVERVSEPTRGMRLRIAIPSLFASQRLMPALASLQREQPDLHIDVDTGPNRLSRLSDGLDAAIVIARAVDKKLYSRALEAGRIVALGSRELNEGPSRIVTPLDLSRTSILLHRDMPEAFDVWREQIGMTELKPRAINFYDAGQLILDAAAEGMGIAFMLESHFEHSGDDRLVRIFEETVESPYTYWFACQPSALERRTVRVFHAWLFDRFGSV